MERIAQMVKANFMFQSLSAQQKDQIFQVMTYRKVKTGDTIIREGDKVIYILNINLKIIINKNIIYYRVMKCILLILVNLKY